MIGLTNLRSSGPPPMAPKLNRRRALFVLEKIDEILHWERTTEQERDTRFVELGRYLCEVRAGQYWRVDNLKSFDEFLEKKFPESATEGVLPDGDPRAAAAADASRAETGGVDEGSGVSQSRAAGRAEVRLCNLVAQGAGAAKGRVQARGGTTSDRQGDGALGDALFQGLQEPAGGRSSRRWRLLR